MPSSAANFRLTVRGAERASFFFEFAFSSSTDAISDGELLATEVFSWREISELEGRVELLDELADDEDCDDRVEVVASLESSVRKEVSVAFSEEAATTWVGLMIWSNPKWGRLCPSPPSWGPTLLDLFRKYHFCFVHSASALF